MARRIRFPLKMKNGAEVRTLDELKANFDLESVLGYFADGKLQTWLSQIKVPKLKLFHFTLQVGKIIFHNKIPQ